MVFQIRTKKDCAHFDKCPQQKKLIIYEMSFEENQLHLNINNAFIKVYIFLTPLVQMYNNWKH